MLRINFEDLLGTTGKECEDKVIEVKNLLAELMREYHVDENVEDNQSSAGPSLANSDDFLSSLNARVASRRHQPWGSKLSSIATWMMTWRI